MARRRGPYRGRVSDATYDFVVVGAGSAGCVLAARLSEDPDRRVLVLEAGGDDGVDEIKIPAAFSTLFRTQYDWSFITVEQKHVLGRRMEWPRGKVIGGSSSINAMLYIRGNRLDYDTWRDAYGCAGWGFDDLLPYFKKAEDNARGASELHGTGGPLRVEDQQSVHELSHAFVESAVAHGIKRNDDFNGAEQDGVGLFQVTQRGGRRWSAADAYLRPALDRPNLDLVTDALVTAGRRRRRPGRRRGVPRPTARRTSVRCDGEVVLSGGAINSPQLLMLSGVGPAPHLREHGIPVESRPGRGRRQPAGPSGSRRALADARYDEPPRPRDHRAAAQVAAPEARPPHLTRRRGVRLPPDPTGPARARPAVPRRPRGLSRQRPRGAVRPRIHRRRHARVAWPAAAPCGWPAPTLAGTRRSTRATSARSRTSRPSSRACGWLVRSPSTARCRGCCTRSSLPGAGVVTDDALRDAIRANAQSLYHPVGTCSMGTGDASVVDEQLRVRGVAGLRVVDASVMPTVPRGNTNAPTIAIAERGADLIRGRAPLAPYVSTAWPTIARSGGQPPERSVPCGLPVELPRLPWIAVKTWTTRARSRGLRWKVVSGTGSGKRCG